MHELNIHQSNKICNRVSNLVTVWYILIVIFILLQKADSTRTEMQKKITTPRFLDIFCTAEIGVNVLKETLFKPLYVIIMTVYIPHSQSRTN